FDRTRLGVGAKTRVDQTAVEPLRLLLRVEHDGVFGDALGSEVVRDRADSDNQSIVAEAARRRDLAALVVVGRATEDQLLFAIEPGQFAVPVAKPMPVRVR